jgi:hypothetical protein
MKAAPACIVNFALTLRKEGKTQLKGKSAFQHLALGQNR